MADGWYQQDEVKLNKIIIVPVTGSYRRQKEWVHLQNNSQLSDVIFVHSAVTGGIANGDIAKDNFTGIVSDFSSNALGETGYLAMNDDWLSFLKTETGNGDKSDKRKGQTGGEPPRKKLRGWGSLRRTQGNRLSGGSGGSGRDDEDDDGKKNKLSGHMNSVWGVIPHHVDGLDQLLIVLRALLAYLFIPGETPEEFINCLVRVIDYLRHSVASESDEIFMNNMLIQLGSLLELNLKNGTNRDDLLNQLNSHTETINANVLQRSHDDLKKIIESLLANLVWLNNPEGGQMLVSIQRLVDNAASAGIKPLKGAKETIYQNQHDIINLAKLNRQTRIENELKKMGITTKSKNNEGIPVSLLEKFLKPEQGQKFFTGKGRDIIKILSEILGNEQIDQLSDRLVSGQWYQLEGQYERLEFLVIKFLEKKGNTRDLVQALNHVLGEGMREAVNRIKEAVTEIPSVNIDTLLGRMVISSPVSQDRPATSEASSPETGSNPFFTQSARDQVIGEIEHFLLNNRVENASSEPLNSQAMDQLSGLLSTEQILQLNERFRADDPWVQRSSQYDPENLSTVIRAILVSSQGGGAFRKLAELLYQILEKTMKVEDIGLLLRKQLKSFDNSSA
ncbi:hypothetical protein [Endozoicomonas euniceicola]|uniref:Uncharacterized protein n=1 Tax=Endozoicomonas euniceicola TaxID=1234143 RepID=A0ABY6GX15_9GAMM|nr:hypothetical protein [Endozoicomonas euniceicola]UYM17315.1 hypothetical protein NX720_05160 [Endozoicomonas euniceicola]